MSPTVDTIDDTSFLDDLNVPRPTESEYWDGFLALDDPTLRILAHSVTAHAAAYNIDSGDILDAMAPVQPRITKATAIDYESKRPYFGWLPLERVKRTCEQCTQHMRLPPSTHLQKQLRSPNPGANIFHCCEADATDMIYSDTPAIDGDKTLAHIFVGLISRVTDVFKAKNDSAECFLGTFQDHVCMCGAPNKLIADNAPMYRSWRITRYVRNIWCPLWQ